MHEDMLGRPIKPDDYVFYYSNIYQVIELLGSDLIRIKLIDASKTTKSVKKNSHEMCIIDTEDVLVWKLKRGY